jgi:hypothetical protein
MDGKGRTVAGGSSTAGSDSKVAAATKGVRRHMKEDLRYDCALAAALVICELFDSSQGQPKHELLANTIFSILHAMERYEEAKAGQHGRFSVN